MALDFASLTITHLEELIHEERVKLGLRVTGIYTDNHPDHSGGGSQAFHDQLLDELSKRYTR